MRYTASILFTAATLIPTAGIADIMPEDVWNDFVASTALFGTLEGAELSREGDTLVASDIRITMPMTGGEFAVEYETRIERMELEAVSGGAVVTRFASPMITTSQGFEMPEVPEMNITSFTTVTGDINVSGAPNDLTYSVEDATFETTTTVEYEDGFLPPSRTESTVEGLNGQWTSATEGTQISGTYDFTANRSFYTTNNPGLETPEMEFSAEISGMSLSGDYDGDSARAEGEDAATLFTGVDFTLNQSIGAASFDMTMGEGDSPIETKVSGTVDASSLIAAMADGIITYEAHSNGLAGNIVSPVVPADAAFFAKNLGVRVTAPLGPKDGAQPFALGMSLVDLGVSQSLWAMFDPTGALAQTPSTFDLSLSGEIDTNGLSPLGDIMAFEDSPPQFLALALETLNLSFAGAQIVASGSAEVPQELREHASVAEMTGAVEIKMTNITTLLDSLAGIGLLPPQQNAMAQMMLGMLARPGENAGELVSRIERTEAGEILANGMPLPF